jgi:hypothetical protein
VVLAVVVRIVYLLGTTLGVAHTPP